MTKERGIGDRGGVLAVVNGRTKSSSRNNKIRSVVSYSPGGVISWDGSKLLLGRPIQLDRLRDFPVDRGAIARDRGKKTDGAQIYLLLPIDLSSETKTDTKKGTRLGEEERNIVNGFIHRWALAYTRETCEIDRDNEARGRDLSL